MQELLLAIGGSGGGYYPNSGPGPKHIEIGDIDIGFFGAVSKELLLTDKVFKAMISGTEYVDLKEEDNVWYKYAFKGKFLYMPKRPIAIDLTHPALYECGMTHPSIDDELYPYSINKVYQDTKLVVTEDDNAYTLSVRLPRVFSDDDSVFVQSAELPLVTSNTVKLAELHNTLIRLIGGAGDVVDFGVVTYSDTLPGGVLNNAKANVLCAEIHTTKGNLVNRRYAAPMGAGDFLATSVYSKKNGSNDIMYRPVLELLPNTVPLQTVKKIEGMSAVPIPVSPIVELSSSELVMPLLLKCEQPEWHTLAVTDLSEIILPQIAHSQKRDQGEYAVIASAVWS